MRSGAVRPGHSPASRLPLPTGTAIPVTTRAGPVLPSPWTRPSANWSRSYRSYAEGDIPRQQFRAGFKTDLPRRVTRRWRELVVQDAGRRTLPLPPVPLAAGPDQHYSRYGTTLIAALVGHGSILVGQIGDGDLLLVRPDGSIEFPLPRDPVPAGNETHSISSPDAHLLWRTATLDRGKGGILLAATDGISDSFNGAESEEFSVFVHSLVDRIRTYGMEAVAAAMAGWLDRYSAVASGDDMTLVWACIHPEAPRRHGPSRKRIRRFLRGRNGSHAACCRPDNFMQSCSGRPCT